GQGGHRGTAGEVRQLEGVARISGKEGEAAVVPHPLGAFSQDPAELAQAMRSRIDADRELPIVRLELHSGSILSGGRLKADDLQGAEDSEPQSGQKSLEVPPLPGHHCRGGHQTSLVPVHLAQGGREVAVIRRLRVRPPTLASVATIRPSRATIRRASSPPETRARKAAFRAPTP